jgi:decaprenyl-phosphate phosphoribosyltransferase
MTREFEAEADATAGPSGSEREVAPSAPEEARGRPSVGAVLGGLVRGARPKQWAKNVLVLAAPFAAGVIGDGATLVLVLLALAAFCLAASGTYLLNDARDADADRLHPVKCRRPIAAGIVPHWLAVASGVLLLAGGFAAAAAIGWPMVGVLALYVGLTTSYTLGLKQIAVVDIAVVASGFMLRAVGGGVAADVALSRWFLIVAAFGSLFMVAGKRYGESMMLGAERGAVRATLSVYPLSYLRYVWTVASGVAVAAYCLWAFEQAPLVQSAPWYELSVVPFTLSILRYALLVETGKGSAPEEIVLGDRTLQVLGLAWVAVFGCGVHFAG